MTTSTPLTGYQRRLLVFLSVAAFFEGYDFIALSQVLPTLAREFSLDDRQVGWLGGAVNLGGILAFFLVRLADRHGRRVMLAVTIAGYTLSSFVTGLTNHVVWFALAQVAANMFLLAEYALSMVYATEEFPADRRGVALGLVQAASSLGSIACAVLVPTLLRTDLGWRLVYFAGTVPLLILAFMRRNLRETRRFAAQGGRDTGFPLLRVFRSAHRRRVFTLALVWTLTYANTKVVLYFWKKHAHDALGLDEQTMGGMIAIAAAASLPFLFGWPFVVDRLGRRGAAVGVMLALSASTLGCYLFTSYSALLCALFLCIFASSAVAVVLNALTSEVFPTALRADGYAWSNNLLGRLGSLAGPPITGQLAASLGGYAVAIAPSAVAPLLALLLILWLLPETAGRELEELEHDAAPSTAG